MSGGLPNSWSRIARLRQARPWRRQLCPFVDDRLRHPRCMKNAHEFGGLVGGHSRHKSLQRRLAPLLAHRERRIAVVHVGEDMRRPSAPQRALAATPMAKSYASLAKTFFQCSCFDGGIRCSNSCNRLSATLSAMARMSSSERRGDRSARSLPRRRPARPPRFHRTAVLRRLSSNRGRLPSSPPSRAPSLSYLANFSDSTIDDTVRATPWARPMRSRLVSILAVVSVSTTAIMS